MNDVDGVDLEQEEDHTSGTRKQSLQMEMALRTINVLWPREKTLWSVAEPNIRHSRLGPSQGKFGATKKAKPQKASPKREQKGAYLSLKESSVDCLLYASPSRRGLSTSGRQSSA